MSWRKITMKFAGTCTVCGQKIEANEVGLWAKGLGVKHPKCAGQQIKELQCVICGNPAGCPSCEFQQDCNRDIVSELCICKKCSQLYDVFELYKKSVKNKIPLVSDV